MSTYYEAPTSDNVLSMGHFGGGSFVAVNGFAVTVYNGPWNMSWYPLQWPFSSGVPAYSDRSGGGVTVYHFPFPTMSDQVFTFNTQCRPPNTPNLPSHAKYLKNGAFHHPLDFAVEVAAMNSDGYNSGFSPYGICYVEPSNVPSADVYNDGSYAVRHSLFKPPSGTDFTSKCGSSSFSAATHSDLNANGAYVIPRGQAFDLNWAEYTQSSGYTKATQVSLRKRSIGMAPLYPRDVMVNLALSRAVYEEGSASYNAWTAPTTTRTVNTFFGQPRCDFYKANLCRGVRVRLRRR